LTAATEVSTATAAEPLRPQLLKPLTAATEVSSAAAAEVSLATAAEATDCNC